MSERTERGCYIGVDTSNYTTSVALAGEDGRVFHNERLLLPVKAGERGLRQSDAVFAHIRHMPTILEGLRAALFPAGKTPWTVRGIGYSATPRRREDSYMPCFLTGEAVALAMRAVTDAPAVAFSHQEGHIMAALYSAAQELARQETARQEIARQGADGRVDDLPNAAERTAALMAQDFLAFHVSGGTTDVLAVSPAQIGFSVSIIGQSLDLHAGQAVDRVGVAMGLPFPCGREMERLAAEFTGKVPKPRVSVDGMSCHLSGLENLACALYRRTKDAALTSAYTLDFIAETLAAMSEAALGAYPGRPILFAGGVMSNRRIQRRLAVRLGGKTRLYFSAPAFSADNAAGIALLCRRAVIGQTQSSATTK